jgi:putative inorganic carbon (HCO3(-)) transporter
VTGPFKSYGLLAAYFACTFFYVSLFFARSIQATKNFFLKIFYFLIPAASLWLILLTRSRGGMLAILGSSLILLRGLRKWKIMLALFLVAVAGFFALPKAMIYHLDSIQQEQSVFERLDLWERAIDVIKVKPITGTGVNTYTAAHPKYDKLKSSRVRHYYAHNGYLQLTAEIGIPGLFFFLAFLTCYFRDGLKQLPSSPYAPQSVTLLTGIVAFLIFTVTDTILHNEQTALMFWFLLGLQCAYMKAAAASKSIS